MKTEADGSQTAETEPFDLDLPDSPASGPDNGNADGGADDGGSSSSDPADRAAAPGEPDGKTPAPGTRDPQTPSGKDPESQPPANWEERYKDLQRTYTGEREASLRKDDVIRSLATGRDPARSTTTGEPATHREAAPEGKPASRREGLAILARAIVDNDESVDDEALARALLPVLRPLIVGDEEIAGAYGDRVAAAIQMDRALVKVKDEFLREFPQLEKADQNVVKTIGEQVEAELSKRPEWAGLKYEERIRKIAKETGAAATRILNLQPPETPAGENGGGPAAKPAAGVARGLFSEGSGSVSRPPGSAQSEKQREVTSFFS